jgi:AraC family transcriptional regulator
VGLREADAAIRVCHLLVWRDWQLLSHERQRSDLVLHLSDLAGDVLPSIQRWRDTKPYASFPPDLISDEEGQDFRNSMAGLIAQLYEEYSAAAWDRFSGTVNHMDGDDRVRRALAVLNERYSDAALCLGVLSKRTCISKRHLARLLKAHAGTSFSQLLRDKRVEKAAELLARSAYPIKTIAGLVGYRDWSHFGRDFRARTGCTPGQFRAKKLSRQASGL